jgi:hypothetical protein
MELVQNIWTRYGFRGNPFDTAALSAMAGDILPIAKAIVGRGMDSPESKMLLGVLRSAGGGRPVVEGDIGVGKTTFLNCLPASPRWSPDLLLCQRRCAHHPGYSTQTTEKTVCLMAISYKDAVRTLPYRLFDFAIEPQRPRVAVFLRPHPRQAGEEPDAGARGKL